MMGWSFWFKPQSRRSRPFGSVPHILTSILRALRTSGRVVGFNMLGEDWPARPPTCFYDWLYGTALSQHPDAARAMGGFAAFSDIAFNPEKSLNCQARSAALFVALSRRGLLGQATQGKDAFVSVTSPKPEWERRGTVQPDLFSDGG